jgi:hypothetical protein
MGRETKFFQTTTEIELLEDLYENNVKTFSIQIVCPANMVKFSKPYFPF